MVPRDANRVIEVVNFMDATLTAGDIRTYSIDHLETVTCHELA